MHATGDIRLDTQGFTDFGTLSEDMKFNTLVRTSGDETNYLVGCLAEG